MKLTMILILRTSSGQLCRVDYQKWFCGKHDRKVSPFGVATLELV